MLLARSGGSATEAYMRLTRKLSGKAILKTAGVCLLAVFLQWAGMADLAQKGTVYSQMAHLVGAGAPGDTLAKLPPQQ
jgi:hypothetical protein